MKSRKKKNINKRARLCCRAGVVICCAFISFAPVLSGAVTLERRLADPALEERAVALFKEIRCVSCAGESIYDSRGRLARDFRIAIRKKLREGQSEEAIRAFFTERYGQSVLAQPAVKAHPFLWFAPALFLLPGLTAAALFMRRRRKAAGNINE